MLIFHRNFFVTILFVFFLLPINSLFATTIDSLLSSSLVVYNGNIGLVHEDKKLSLKKGRQAIVYDDVARTVQTDSVNVIFPDDVILYSQQYRFDRVTSAKLLDAHIGKAIKVKLSKNNKNTVIHKAKLIAADGDDCIIKMSNGDIITVPLAKLIFDEIPNTLITKPSLLWNIDAAKPINGKISLDYLINNISWQSNYVLNVNENIAALTGWITVDNRSGKRFDGTQLNVLAGDINRAKHPSRERKFRVAAMVMEDAGVAQIAHEGYHFYTVPFKVTLANNEKTQIKFIDKNKLPIKRRYEAKLNHPNYLNGEIKHKVSQFIEIESLDIPLPSGVIRSYSKVKNTTLLLGENRIQHTPKNEKISLRIGTNFDIKVVEKVQTVNDDKYYFDRDIVYEVDNSSDKEKMVELYIPYTKSDSRAKASVDTQQKYNWKNAHTMRINLTVKARAKETFKVHFRSKK